MLYNLDEITLIPSPVSTIKSRSECDTAYYYTGYKMYPIFVSPMACLVDDTNVETLKSCGLNVIVPRTVPWGTRMDRMVQNEWVAVGLKEAKNLYYTWSRVLANGFELEDFTPHLCIDQANGHMKELLELCRDFKLLLGKDGIRIMTGNIAHPNTYYDYAIHGIDYVRCSVGTGHGCTTSCQTGFNYPMGSLLIDINKQKKLVERDLLDAAIETDKCIYTLPKVIADGGIGTSEQAIKALALGADYVMLGEVIARSMEACGREIPIEEEWDDHEDDWVDRCGRVYYGMSTERAQREINKASYEPNPDFNPKRAEGIEKIVPIEYSINWWLTDFGTDLRSAMSYANAKNLQQFIGKVQWDTISYDSRMKFMGKLEK